MRTIPDPRAKSVRPVWAVEIESWCAHQLASGLSENTVATRRDHLQRVSRALAGGPWETSTEDLIEWAADQKWAVETRRSMHNSLRSFFRWGVDAGRSDTDPTRKLPHPKAAHPHPRPAPQRVVDSAIDRSDPRTRLILRLAIELGLRRGEIAQIHADDIWNDLDGATLTVHGKGNKDRNLPLAHSLAFTLRSTCQGGWLFPSDRHPSGHLTPRYVGKLAARVLTHPWTLHTLRHACATEVYRATRDILLVMQILGHSSVATTQRYIKMLDDRLRGALDDQSRRHHRGSGKAGTAGPHVDTVAANL